MKRDLDCNLIRIDGEPFMASEGEGAEPMTLKMLTFMAVSMQIPTDRDAGVEEKMSLYRLAAKTIKGGVVELTTEEISLLKSRIGKCFPSLVVGEAFRLLEQDYIEPPAAVEHQQV